MVPSKESMSKYTHTWSIDFPKGADIIQWGKVYSFYNKCHWNNWISTHDKRTLALILYLEINSKLAIHVFVKSKTIKL